MNKIKLDIDRLHVDSFQTAAADEEAGTCGTRCEARNCAGTIHRL